jgi:hypothetical protein
MRKLLSKIFPLFQSAEGFVYVPDVEPGLMKDAKPDSTIRNPTRQPPWFVVYHSIQAVFTARWPGKLWRVEIVRAAAEQPNAGADYTRAVAVRILAEVPTFLVFGEHGAAVSRIIDRARALELKHVEVLGQSVCAQTREAYSRAWNKWLAQADSASSHLGADLSSTLAMPGLSSRSPINGGFTVLYSALAARARALVGETAFVANDEGEEFFSPEWDLALDALLGAAMAYGAPDLVSAADRASLTSAWVRVFGELDAG